MCRQPAQTLLVAAETAVDLFRLPVFQLVHPIRVCQKLAAHGGALDASADELLLHKIRVVQTTDTTDGQLGVLPHLIAEFEEAVTPACSSSGTNTGSSSSTTPALPKCGVSCRTASL